MDFWAVLGDFLSLRVCEGIQEMLNKRQLPTAEQLRALLEVWQEIEAAQQTAEESGRPANREIGGGELLLTVWPTRYRTIGPDGLDDLGDFAAEPQETS